MDNPGVCVSYDEMVRMDYNLVDREIHPCCENIISLPESITSTSIVHAYG